MPWARATRPTSGSPSVESGLTSHPRFLLVVAKLQRRLGPFELCGRTDQRTHRGRRPTLTPDHASQFARRHEQFDQHLSPVLSFGHPNGLRTIRARPGHDFDDVAAATHEADRAAAGSAAAGGIRATSVLTVSDGTAPALIQWSSR